MFSLCGCVACSKLSAWCRVSVCSTTATGNGLPQQTLPTKRYTDSKTVSGLVSANAGAGTSTTLIECPRFGLSFEANKRGQEKGGVAVADADRDPAQITAETTSTELRWSEDEAYALKIVQTLEVTGASAAHRSPLFGLVKVRARNRNQPLVY